MKSLEKIFSVCTDKDQDYIGNDFPVTIYRTGRRILKKQDNIVCGCFQSMGVGEDSWEYFE